MTLTQLRTKARLLLGNITSTQYSDANLNRAINDSLHNFTERAILANGNWSVNGEVSTANVVANQQEYLFPSDLLSIYKIECNFTGGDKQWITPALVDLRNTPTLSNQTTATSGINTVRIYDHSIFFDWPPANNVTGGIKIWWSKEATELSGATDEPELPNFLHEGLIYSACLDYCIESDQTAKQSTFKTLLNEKYLECDTFYKNRMPIKRSKITTRKENYA